MSPIGRPKSDNPKKFRLEIRLTEEEDARLKRCAEVLHVSRTEVINRGITLVEKEMNKK